FGSACHAELASVPDDLVGEQRPLFFRDHFHQVLFNFRSVVAFGELEAFGNPGYVGVDDYTLVFLEPGAQNDVGRLTGYTRQRKNLFHIVGNVSAEFFDDFRSRAYNRFRLVTKKTRGVDIRLQLLGRERSEVLDRRIFLEQNWSDPVD